MILFRNDHAAQRVRIRADFLTDLHIGQMIFLAVMIHSFVARDGKQPGGKITILTVATKGFVSRQEGLAGHVFRVLDVTQTVYR